MEEAKAAAIESLRLNLAHAQQKVVEVEARVLSLRAHLAAMTGELKSFEATLEADRQHVKDLRSLIAKYERGEDFNNDLDITKPYFRLEAREAHMLFLEEQKRIGRLGPFNVREEVFPAIRRGGSDLTYKRLKQSISLNASEGNIIYDEESDTIALPQP